MWYGGGTDVALPTERRRFYRKDPRSRPLAPPGGRAVLLIPNSVFPIFMNIQYSIFDIQ
jgi:hypothetical protein